MDFAVPADHRIKLKESEKKDKYHDLAGELKKLWNMKVTIVPIVIRALDTVTKGLLKGLEDLEVGGRVETIQMTALLRTARIPRRGLETYGDLLSLKLQWKPSANTDVKNSKGVNNNIYLYMNNTIYIYIYILTIISTIIIAIITIYKNNIYKKNKKEYENSKLMK